MQKLTVENILLYGFEDHEPHPFDCPVCKLAMRDARDRSSFESLQCCYECKESFYYLHSEGWLKGERPDDEDLANYLRKRGMRPSYSF